MVIKNFSSIPSMHEMTDVFNHEECARNICPIPGKEEKEFLPYCITINKCLEKLEPEEFQGFRK